MNGSNKTKCQRTPERAAWYGAQQRCNNPKCPKYASYGGRGIRFCEEWSRSFETFLGHVGLRPSTDHSLDRIDVDGHYEPGNVRWATRSEQQRNRRCGQVTWQGRTQSVSAWAEERGIKAHTLWCRLFAWKWSVDDAMTAPLSRGAHQFRNGGSHVVR